MIYLENKTEEQTVWCPRMEEILENVEYNEINEEENED